MKQNIKKTAWLGMLLAFALILSYVEALIPFPFMVPGMKLGLANMATLLVLYLIGEKEAAIVSVSRIILVGFLFGNLYSIMYSLAGGILALLVMVLSKRTGFLSCVGVSILGGVFHNIGQLAVAALIVDTKAVFYYLPVLLIGGMVCGALLGIVTVQIINRVDPSGQRKERQV